MVGEVAERLGVAQGPHGRLFLILSSSFPNPFLIFPLAVSTLKEQLENMRKISQNSQASNDKIAQLQSQVSELMPACPFQLQGIFFLLWLAYNGQECFFANLQFMTCEWCMECGRRIPYYIC